MKQAVNLAEKRMKSDMKTLPVEGAEQLAGVENGHIGALLVEYCSVEIVGRRQYWAESVLLNDVYSEGNYERLCEAVGRIVNSNNGLPEDTLEKLRELQIVASVLDKYATGKGYTIDGIQPFAV